MNKIIVTCIVILIGIWVFEEVQSLNGNMQPLFTNDGIVLAEKGSKMSDVQYALKHGQAQLHDWESKLEFNFFDTVGYGSRKYLHYDKGRGMITTKEDRRNVTDLSFSARKGRIDLSDGFIFGVLMVAALMAAMVSSVFDKFINITKIHLIITALVLFQFRNSIDQAVVAGVIIFPFFYLTLVIGHWFNVMDSNSEKKEEESEVSSGAQPEKEYKMT